MEAGNSLGGCQSLGEGGRNLSRELRGEAHSRVMARGKSGRVTKQGMGDVWSPAQSLPAAELGDAPNPVEPSHTQGNLTGEHQDTSQSFGHLVLKCVAGWGLGLGDWRAEDMSGGRASTWVD